MIILKAAVRGAVVLTGLSDVMQYGSRAPRTAASKLFTQLNQQSLKQFQQILNITAFMKAGFNARILY